MSAAGRKKGDPGGTAGSPGELPAVDRLALRLGPELSVLLEPGSGFYRRLMATCVHFVRQRGLPLPPLCLHRDRSLAPSAYRIEVAGNPEAEGSFRIGLLLAVGDDAALSPLLGEETAEPVYGMPARWIGPTQAETASARGCILLDAGGLIATHLVEVLQREAHRLLDQAGLEVRLRSLLPEHRTLLTQLRRHPGLSGLRVVLRRLVREQVPLVDLLSILEAVARFAPQAEDPEALTELVRAEIPHTLCAPYLDEDGQVPAVVLSSRTEQVLKQQLSRDTGLDPEIGERFLGVLSLELNELMEQGWNPVLLVDFELRAGLRGLVERDFPELGVLSWAEIPPTVGVRTLATLGSRFHPWARKMASQHWTVVSPSPRGTEGGGEVTPSTASSAAGAPAADPGGDPPDRS